MCLPASIVAESTLGETTREAPLAGTRSPRRKEERKKLKKKRLRKMRRKMRRRSRGMKGCLRGCGCVLPAVPNVKKGESSKDQTNPLNSARLAMYISTNKQVSKRLHY